MDKEELQTILNNHKLYIETDRKKGSFAYLKGANLRGVDLRGANLRGANLINANLKDANLFYANLKGAELENANLSGANLNFANLFYANLQGANLKGARLEFVNLESTNLKGANLEGANLESTHLKFANLKGANLEGAKLPNFQIPQNVELTGWKKLENDRIAKLRIPAEAKRTTSLVGNKCRCEYAEVVEITSLDGTIPLTSGFSIHRFDFEYQVGMKVEPDSYDDDIRVECTNGIHFFLDRKDAMYY